MPFYTFGFIERLCSYYGSLYQGQFYCDLLNVFSVTVTEILRLSKPDKKAPYRIELASKTEKACFMNKGKHLGKWSSMSDCSVRID